MHGTYNLGYGNSIAIKPTRHRDHAPRQIPISNPPHTRPTRQRQTLTRQHRARDKHQLETILVPKRSTSAHAVARHLRRAWARFGDHINLGEIALSGISGCKEPRNPCLRLDSWPPVHWSTARAQGATRQNQCVHHCFPAVARLPHAV
jgi:hypothetical protein